MPRTGGCNIPHYILAGAAAAVSVEGKGGGGGGGTGIAKIAPHVDYDVLGLLGERARFRCKRKGKGGGGGGTRLGFRVVLSRAAHLASEAGAGGCQRGGRVGEEGGEGRRKGRGGERSPPLSM